MSQTHQLDHVWIEIMQTPVEVKVDPENPNRVLVIKKTSDIQKAEENSSIGCAFCREGAYLDTIETVCPGPKELDESPYDQEEPPPDSTS